MKKENPVAAAFRKLLQNKLATLCFVVMLVEILLVIFAPVFTQYDPNDMQPIYRLHPASGLKMAAIIWRVTGLAQTR